MMPTASSAIVFLIGMCGFSLAYGQAPLYYSNQNQYFLHGLADAGQGFLADDWLANTADPTPVFSLLVAATVRWLHPLLFHAYYAAIFGVYFVSLVGIFGWLARARNSWRLRIVFMALLMLVHSAAARWASYRLLGWDYPWYFQAGVAGQYVLGAMFQPSTFGVLLILSIHLHVTGRPYWAAAAAAGAATLHSTYLLSAGIVTLAFMVAWWREGMRSRSVMVGGLALLLALPITLFVAIRFQPLAPKPFGLAQDILVHFRIPHHCLPELWCDTIALVQIGWIAVAIILVRKTRLFPALLTMFLASGILTIAQVLTGNDTLALLFPWRLSVVLMPIATTIILARSVLETSRWLDTRTASALGVAGMAMLAGAGLVIMLTRQAYQTSSQELAVMNFVRSTVAGGDTYLLPVKMPDLKKSTRGSQSSDFKPLAAKKSDARLIPVDLQRFRLYTGGPIYVDFKAIPYKDTDVLEWKERLEMNQKILEDLESDDIVPTLQRLGITHLVLKAEIKLRHAELQQLYADDMYQVVRVAGRTASSGE